MRLALIIINILDFLQTCVNDTFSFDRFKGIFHHFLTLLCNRLMKWYRLNKNHTDFDFGLTQM